MLAVRVFVVALTLALASAQADILALHNGYRKAHQVPPLTSSAALTSAAQSWANRLAASCTFEHARGTGQGENLASGHRSWTEVARGWYNEVRQYNYGAPGFGMSTGHFTQMVWKGTTQLGCASAMSKCSSRTIYVCRYSPPGNVQGAFRSNVLPATP
ncbi:CAP domain-containing protein [Haematococcus lacustris]